MGFDVQVAAFAIARMIQREQYLGRELAALFQHLVDDVGIDLGMLRHLLQFLFDLQQFVQNELHVSQRCNVLAHGFLLGGESL